MGMLEYDLAFHRTIKLHIYSWLVKAFYYLDWLMDDWRHNFVLFFLLRSVQVCTTVKTQIRTFLDIFFFTFLDQFELNNQRKRMWANVLIQWLSLFAFTGSKAVTLVRLSARLVCQQGKMKWYLCWVTEFGASWQLWNYCTIKIRFKWSTF